MIETQQSLVEVSDDLFLFQVLRYGLETEKWSESRHESFIQYDLPLLANELIEVQHVKFSDPQEVEKAIRDTILVVNLGLDIRAAGDRESGVKVLLHSQGGIKWCFRKGKTELKKIFERVQSLVQLATVAVPPRSKARMVAPDFKAINLLSKTDMDFFKTILVVPSSNTTLVYPLGCHIQDRIAYSDFQKKLDVVETKLLFLKALPLEPLFESESLFSTSMDISVGFSQCEGFLVYLPAGLMVNMGGQGQVRYEVSLNALDAFREKVWDEKQTSFKDRSYVPVLKFIADRLRTQQLPEAVCKWGFAYAFDIFSSLEAIFKQKKYSLDTQANYVGLREFFILPTVLELQDPRLFFVDAAARAEDSMSDEDPNLNLYASFFESSDAEKLRLLKRMSGEKCYYLLSEYFWDTRLPRFREAEIAGLLKKLASEVVTEFFYLWEARWRKEITEANEKGELAPDEKVVIVPWDKLFGADWAVSGPSFLDVELARIFQCLPDCLQEKVKITLVKLAEERGL